MLKRLALTLCCGTALTAAAVACSSEEEAPLDLGAHGGGGAGGAGGAAGSSSAGESYGGNAGEPQGGSSGNDTGGNGGAPPPPPTCDLDACQPLTVAGQTLAACCLPATNGCGVDTTLVSSVTMGAIPPGCNDPGALGGGLDAGPPEDIVLDDTCPGIDLTIFTLPGCCTVEGFCGGSTQDIAGQAGGAAPIGCFRNQEIVDGLAAAGFAGLVAVPADPNQACTYPDGSDASTPPDPDASTLPGPDAATQDGSTSD